MGPVRTPRRRHAGAEADCDPSLAPWKHTRRALPGQNAQQRDGLVPVPDLTRPLRLPRTPTSPNSTISTSTTDKIVASGQDLSLAASVLERANIRALVTTLGNRGAQPAKNSDNIYFILDAHYLFCPGVAIDLQPFFDGERPMTTDRLEHLLRAWLDHAAIDRVRFTNTFLPIEQRFLPPDLAQTQSILDHISGSGKLLESDLDTLVHFVSWTVLAWHHDHRKALQIAAVAEYFICEGKSIPRFQYNWTSEMARAFDQFKDARFDLLLASDILAHEAAVVARQLRNVHALGYWWHNSSPPPIEKTSSCECRSCQ